MIKPSQLPVHSHFWAEMDNQIVVINKTTSGYTVAGPWECEVKESDFYVIELIQIPTGYTWENLYYK